MGLFWSLDQPMDWEHLGSVVLDQCSALMLPRQIGRIAQRKGVTSFLGLSTGCICHMYMTYVYVSLLSSETQFHCRKKNADCTANWMRVLGEAQVVLSRWKSLIHTVEKNPFGIQFLIMHSSYWWFINSHFSFGSSNKIPKEQGLEGY